MKCPACDADTHYKEHGRAWIGGFGAGLAIAFHKERTDTPFVKGGLAKVEDLCTKHRQSLCGFLEQVNATLGSKLRIVARGAGWYLVNEDVRDAEDPS